MSTEDEYFSHCQDCFIDFDQCQQSLWAEVAVCQMHVYSPKSVVPSDRFIYCHCCWRGIETLLEVVFNCYGCDFLHCEACHDEALRFSQAIGRAAPCYKCRSRRQSPSELCSMPVPSVSAIDGSISTIKSSDDHVGVGAVLLVGNNISCALSMGPEQ